MQLQSDRPRGPEEIKTQFRAREGYYRLMNSPDYSQRSQRAMGFSTGTANSNSSTASHEKTCIKISLVTISDNDQTDTNSATSNSKTREQRLHGNSGLSTNTTSLALMKTHRRSRGARDMKICFNVGRELFVYNYDGVRTGPDASNPIYKRYYKGSSPTCHDINQAAASPRSIRLLVGFLHGQIQLVELNSGDDQESCKDFNSDRLIDRTRVTCVKWLPNSSSLFLVAHASGQLYLYKDDLPCGPAAPTYQVYKQSGGVVVYTCKTKTTRNPIYRWSIGNKSSEYPSQSSSLVGSTSSLNKADNESCALNEFVFSPCAKYLACVSQDGFLRVYSYDTMELIGRARSYYGGFTCVCWSPDGKYIVIGGEDDLITVWSFVERRVVARGVGHKSWVSVVAFDSFYSGQDLRDPNVDNFDDDEEEDKVVSDRDLEGDEDYDDIDDFNSRELKNCRNFSHGSKSPSNRSNNVYQNTAASNFTPVSHGKSSNATSATTYRFGSVGQDTQLCLWDLSDDLLQQQVTKSKTVSIVGISSISNYTTSSNMCAPADSTSDQARNLEKLHLNATTSDTRTGSSELSNYESSINTTSKDTSSNKSGLLPRGSGFTKTFSLVGKRDKRNLSQRNFDKSQTSKNLDSQRNDPNRLIEDPTRLLGSAICPRMSEVPLIEPTVCKKISFERLTSLIFCQGGFITSCQDGYVFSWARPSRRTTRVSPGQSNEELRVIDVGTSSAV